MLSHHWLHVVAAAMTAIAPGAFAKSVLNDTGMQKCLDTSGRLSSACFDTGQDGEFGRDVTQPRPDNGKAGFAFQRMCNSGELAGQGACPATPVLGGQPNDWGCTFDQVTGLLWELKTSDGGARDYRKVYTNFGDQRAGDASRYPAKVNQSTLCGRSDWRLPTPSEILSIVDHGVLWPKPMINLPWFPNTSRHAVWTGVAQVGIDSQAWSATLTYGTILVSQRYFKLGVRLVSAPTDTTAPIKAQGDEVVDSRTGLVWRRCGEGQIWTGNICAGDLTAFNAWHSALAYAKAEAQRTGKDWRLPNAKELFSIVDTSRAAPAIDPVFDNTSSDRFYWTSTPLSSQPDDSMPMAVRCIEFNSGHLGASDFQDNGNPLWLRLVRNTK